MVTNQISQLIAIADKLAFDTESQAQEYIQSFEDWEQDLLEIDFNPF